MMDQKILVCVILWYFVTNDNDFSLVRIKFQFHMSLLPNITDVISAQTVCDLKV